MKNKLMIILLIVNSCFFNSFLLSSNGLDLLANVAVSRLNSENKKPNNQEKSNLPSEAMKIATSSVDMSIISSENSFNGLNIQNNLPKKEKSFVMRRKKRFVKENPDSVKYTNKSDKEYHRLYSRDKYWKNDAHRAEKCAKQREYYLKKKLHEQSVQEI